MPKTSWIIRFCCTGGEKRPTRRKCARCLPGQTRRGFVSQPSGTEAEKNGYRSEMSPGGGPACARCQEAEPRLLHFVPVFENKTPLTCYVNLILVLFERREYAAHISNHNIITVTLWYRNMSPPFRLPFSRGPTPLHPSQGFLSSHPPSAPAEWFSPNSK